jgi:hypothetical protein
MGAAAAMIAVSSAAGQGFVRWEYQRSLFFPRGWDYFTSSLTAGTSDRVGGMRARTFWSYVDDKARRPALSRFELHLDGVSALGQRWDLALGDLRCPGNAGDAGATQMRGVALVGNLGPALTSESFVGRAADRYSGSNAPAFRDNGWFFSQGLRASLGQNLTLRHSLTMRRDVRQNPSAYGLPSAQDLLVFSNTVAASPLPAVRGNTFLNFSRAGYGGGTARADANCGTQWELGLPGYRANLAYQYKGAQYVGPSNEGRENGYQLVSLSNSGTPLPGWNLNAGYSQRWPQRVSDPSRGVSQSQRWFAGSSYNRGRWPLAVYSVERYAADNRVGTAVFQPRHWRHSLNLSRSWRDCLLQAGYQNLRSRGEASAGVFNLSNQVSLSASRRWRDWQAYLNQQLTKQSYRRQLQWYQSLNGDYTWATAYTSGIQLHWSLARADGLSWGTEHWGWELSQRADWTSGWSLATAVKQRFYAGGSPGAQFRTLQWDLAVEKRFARARDAVDFGIARGRVYEDNNGNGRHDPGEPGIATVAVLLDGVRRAVTDGDGSYHVSGIAPGRHTLTVDQRMLSAVLDPADKGGKRFTSVGVWGPVLDFPVTPLNKVIGIVYADSNRNGVQDPGEPGLPGAYVLMGEQRSFTSTDEDGYFRFFNVRPGRYPVFIDPKFLPDTLEVSGPASYPVEVEDMKKVPPVLFGIAKRVRPVRRVVFPPSAPQAAPAAGPPPRTPRPAAATPARPKPPAAEIRRLRDLGIRQYSGGEYQKALQTWQQLLRLDPSNAEATRNLARTRMKLEALKKIQR